MKLRFHKWKKELLISDKIIALAILVLLGILNYNYVIIGAYFLLLPYIIFTKRVHLFGPFFLSTLIAILWVLIAKNYYGYNQNFLLVYGLNLYPLFAWAVGLFLVYLIYTHYERRFHSKGFILKLLYFVAFYWPVLILVETIGYHIFNIRNVVTGMYSGLAVCDCIHAPLWMQVSYFLLGPIYFIGCYLFGFEKPYYKVSE